MPVFTSTTEAEKYIGDVFEDTFSIPEVREGMAKSGLTMKLVMSEPDAIIVCDMVNQKVYRGADATAVEPNVTLTWCADVANRFWQGKVNFPLALARGQIKLSGSKTKVLGLLPLAGPIQRRYVQKLTEEGRSDLLA